MWNALADARPKMSASKGLVLAPFLYAWVSEDECAPDLRGLQSRPRPHGYPAGYRVSQLDALHPSTPRCDTEVASPWLCTCGAKRR